MKTEDKDAIAYLKDIAWATRRTERNTFWIALPIWISIALAVWAVFMRR